MPELVLLAVLFGTVILPMLLMFLPVMIEGIVLIIRAWRGMPDELDEEVK